MLTLTSYGRWNLSNIKVLTKRDSNGSLSKRSNLVLRLSILFYKIYIIKARSLEVSKKRNAALTTMKNAAIVSKVPTSKQRGFKVNQIIFVLLKRSSLTIK